MSDQLTASSGFVKKGTKAFLNYQTLLEKLKHMKAGTLDFTIEVDDPVDQSFVQRFSENDAQVTSETYNRTRGMCNKLGIEWKLDVEDLMLKMKKAYNPEVKHIFVYGYLTPEFANDYNFCKNGIEGMQYDCAFVKNCRLY